MQIKTKYKLSYAISTTEEISNVIEMKVYINKCRHDNK